jgi:hypothetical protein
MVRDSLLRAILERELQRREQEKQLREERARKVRDAIASAYEETPAPAYCIRRLEVVLHVAGVLGVSILNNAFFAEVETAARGLGFQAVRNGNRSLFRCAKRRDQDDAEALAVSRANRHDPRWPRAAEPAVLP